MRLYFWHYDEFSLSKFCKKFFTGKPNWKLNRLLNIKTIFGIQCFFQQIELDTVAYPINIFTAVTKAILCICDRLGAVYIGRCHLGWWHRTFWPNVGLPTVSGTADRPCWPTSQSPQSKAHIGQHQQFGQQNLQYLHSVQHRILKLGWVVGPQYIGQSTAHRLSYFRVQVKQCTYFPLVSATEMAIFGKLSWPNLTFLTPSLLWFPLTKLSMFSPHLAYFGPPYPA
jgi:hypothetical protein